MTARERSARAGFQVLFELRRSLAGREGKLASVCVDGVSTGTEWQPSMAPRRLKRSSSIVSPCVSQPGMEGTSAQKPPSSALWTITWIVIRKWWRRRELNPRPKWPEMTRLRVYPIHNLNSALGTGKDSGVQPDWF